MFSIYRKDGKIDGGIFDMTYNEFAQLAQAENAEILFAYDFKARGKTYSDRKAYVESFAIEWSTTEKPDLAYNEWQYVADEFYRLGKKYGLLSDFRENCIC